MTTDNFCSYLQNRLFQTSQTGGQRYSDTSPFSIPCLRQYAGSRVNYSEKSFMKFATGSGRHQLFTSKRLEPKHISPPIFFFIFLDCSSTDPEANEAIY
jgi:hypothetical protein